MAVINEIVTTEKDYAADLNILIKFYINTFTQYIKYKIERGFHLK